MSIDVKSKSLQLTHNYSNGIHTLTWNTEYPLNVIGTVLKTFKAVASYTESEIFKIQNETYRCVKLNATDADTNIFSANQYVLCLIDFTNKTVAIALSGATDSSEVDADSIGGTYISDIVSAKGTYSGDMNELIIPGVYIVVDCDNMPEDATWGTVIVYAGDNRSCVQDLTVANSKNKYYRNFDSSNQVTPWTEWTNLYSEVINADMFDSRTSNEFASVRTITEQEELDDPNLESGIYSVSSIELITGKGTFYTVIHNQYMSEEGLNYNAQIAIPFYNGIMSGTYYRVCNDGVWNSWANIADGGNALTINDKYATDFFLAKNVQLSNTDVLNWALADNTLPGTYFANNNCTNLPITSFFFISLNKPLLDYAHTILSVIQLGTGKMWHNSYSAITSTWSGWVFSADGGNADTVDNKHASDFTSTRVIKTQEEVDSIDLESGLYSVQDHELMSGKGLFYLLINNKHRNNAGHNYNTQLAIPYNSGLMVGVYYRICSDGVWNNWVNVADNGNASTVNGHTVNSDVPANAVFTDTTYGNATASAAGLVSTGAQTFSGVKTFSNGITLPNNKYIQVTNTSGTVIPAIAMDSSDELVVGGSSTAFTGGIFVGNTSNQLTLRGNIIKTIGHIYMSGGKYITVPGFGLDDTAAQDYAVLGSSIGSNGTDSLGYCWLGNKTKLSTVLQGRTIQIGQNNSQNSYVFGTMHFSGSGTTHYINSSGNANLNTVVTTGATDLTKAQCRNIVCGTADPDPLTNCPANAIYFKYS